MDLKDIVVRLYIKNYLLPRALIFDKPGFVDFRISGKTEVFSRQVFFPEQFFVDFESRLLEKYGDKGGELLYSIGKKFGYSFAQLGRFENIKDHPGNKVKKWVIIASKFVEGTYASNVTQKINVSKKLVEYTLNNWVICNKLGYDYFFATGGAAGLISWIFQDTSIEGYLSSSNDSGQIVDVSCAPKSYLEKKFSNIYSDINMDGLEQDPREYATFNREVPIAYSKSFQTFLDTNFFDYSKGIMSHNNERFFLFEVTGMYLLEYFIKNKTIQSLLFDSAFNVGTNLFREFNKKDLLGLMEIFSALGWGEVNLLKSTGQPSIIITHFPWTKYFDKVDYVIIRGLLSGLLTRVLGNKILLNKPKIDISSGHLSLLFNSK